MIAFIQSEFIKLKHSKIFLLTVLGALTLPFLLYLSLISGNADGFESMLLACNQFTGSMFNIVLFAIVVSYIFGREYTEHSLKTMMTIPLSRGKFILGKYLMLFIWTMILVAITFLSTCFFGYLGGASNITLAGAIECCKEMFITNILLFLSFSPFVFLSLLVPNMVAAMVTGAAFSIGNLMISSTKYAPYFPWSSSYLIGANEIANYSCNTATSLAVMGKSVLVIDMDPQGNATTSFGIDKTKLENTIYDAIIGDVSVKKVTIPTFIKNLFIVPSNISLSGAGVELSKKENYHIVLKETLKDLPPLFDYIFIDLPPSLGVITVNALVAADSVLIPIQAEYYALEGVADLINTINLVKKRLRTPVPIKGILLTLYDKRTRLSKDVYKELKNHFGSTNLLFNTVIPRNIRLAEAPSYGKPCLIYDPESTGTKAYLSLAKEIIERDGGN